MTRKVEHSQFLEYSVKMYPKIRQNWLQHHEKYHNIRKYKINPIQLRHPQRESDTQMCCTELWVTIL